MDSLSAYIHSCCRFAVDYHHDSENCVLCPASANVMTGLSVYNSKWYVPDHKGQIRGLKKWTGKKIIIQVGKKMINDKLYHVYGCDIKISSSWH